MAAKQCLGANTFTIDLFEWNTYTLTRTTVQGKTSLTLAMNGNSIATMSDLTSSLRIYDDVDFVFGAQTKEHGSGLDSKMFYHGF